MIIRIYFYKHSKTYFGRAIVKQQKALGISWRYNLYSHVEIMFPYKEEFDRYYDQVKKIHNSVDMDKYWLCFSSSEQDGWCRFKAIDINRDNWDYCDIEVSNAEYLEMFEFCRRQNWNKYNKVWIFFAMILNFNKKKRGTWFCSEIVTRILQIIGVWCTLNSLFARPWQLAEYLEESWYIIRN